MDLFFKIPAGPMSFEISFKQKTASTRTQHSDVRQVYKDSSSTVDEYDFVFGSNAATLPDSLGDRFSTSLQLHFNHTRRMNPNPERT